MPSPPRPARAQAAASSESAASGLASTSARGAAKSSSFMRIVATWPIDSPSARQNDFCASAVAAPTIAKNADAGRRTRASPPRRTSPSARSNDNVPSRGPRRPVIAPSARVSAFATWGRGPQSARCSSKTSRQPLSCTYLSCVEWSSWARRLSSLDVVTNVVVRVDVARRGSGGDDPDSDVGTCANGIVERSERAFVGPATWRKELARGILRSCGAEYFSAAWSSVGD